MTGNPGNLGLARGGIRIDASGVRTGMQEAQNAARTGMAGIKNMFTSGLQSVGGQMQAVGGQLSVAFAPVSGFVAAGTLAFLNFDEALTQIRARTGATAEQMELVRTTALQMGQDTQFSATQAANGMLELLASGSSVQEAIATLPDVLNLAAAANLDLGVAADSVTDILAQYQLTVESSGAVTNALVAAMQSSSATMPDLVAGFANVGPVAAQFNLSVDDTAAILAVFAENGIKGAEAGTQLRTMLTAMSRPTADVQEAWQRLGLSLFDATGNVRPLNDVLEALNAKMAGMTEQERIETVKVLAGSFGQMGLSALLASDGFDDMAANMTNAQSAAAVAEGQMGSLRQILNQVRSSVETIGIVIFEAFGEKMKDAGKELAGFINNMTSFLQKNPAVAAALGALLVILGGIGPALIAVGTYVKLLGFGFSGLGTLLGSSVLPILLAIAAVAGVIYLAYQTNFLGLRDIIDSVAADVGPWLTFIAERFRLLAFFIKDMGFKEGVINWFKLMALQLELLGKQFPLANKLFNLLTKARDVFELLAGFVKVFVQAYKEGGIEGVLFKLTELLPVVWDMFVQGLRQVWETFAALSPVLLDLFGDLAVAALDWLGDVVTELGPKLGAIYQAILEWAIGTALPALIELGVEFGAAFVKWLIDIIPEYLRLLVRFWGAVLAFIAVDLIPTLIGIGGDIIEGIVNGAIEAGSKLLPQLMNVFGANVGFSESNKQDFKEKGETISLMFAAGALLKWVELRPELKAAFVEISVDLELLALDMLAKGSKLVTALVTGFKAKWDIQKIEWQQQLDELPLKAVEISIALADIGSDMVADFFQAITFEWERHKFGFETLLDDIETAVSDLADEIYEAAKDIGRDLIQGLIDGVSENLETGANLKNSIESTGSAITAWAKSSLGIKSPSTVFNSIGRDLMLGLRDGISNNEFEVTNAISAAVNAAINAASAVLNSVSSIGGGFGGLGGISGLGASASNAFTAPPTPSIGQYYGPGPSMGSFQQTINMQSTPNPLYNANLIGNAAQNMVGQVLQGGFGF